MSDDGNKPELKPTDEDLARLSEAWALCRKGLDCSHLEIEEKLGVALMTRARYAEAEQLLIASYRRQYERLRASPFCSPCAVSATRLADLLVRLYRGLGRPGDADRYEKETAAWK